MVTAAHSSLLLLAPLASFPSQDVAPADLLIEGRVFTGKLDQPHAEALAIRGERIIALGTRDEIHPYRGPDTRVLRTDGSIVAGFNDAHAHFTVGFGMTRELDLSPAESLEETLQLLGEYAQAHPELKVIEGMGWDLPDMPGGRYPTAADLDRVVQDRPVLLWSEGPHAVWVNTKAMDKAGISADTKTPAIGIWPRDEDGKPIGVFLGRGLMGLFRFVPFPDLDRIREGIREGLVEAAALGVTSVHESVSPMLVPFLAELHDAGELTMRFHVWGSPSPSPFGGGAEQHLSLAEQHGREHWITFGTLKTGVDGMPGLRTAALLEPYADAPDTSGLLTFDREGVDGIFARAREHGLGLAWHATGDAGVRIVLDAAAKSRTAFPERHTIEHAFFVHPDDVPRFAKLDVVCSVQPSFLSIDLAKHRFYESYLGAKRRAHVLPLRSLLDSGSVLAFGTDFSLTPLDPRAGLYAATTRRPFPSSPGADSRGDSGEPWVEEERITLAEALRAYTYGSAYAEGAEEHKGTLAAGQLADLVVFEQNLFELDPQALLAAKVTHTIVGGRIVFER